MLPFGITLLLKKYSFYFTVQKVIKKGMSPVQYRAHAQEAA